MNFQAAQDYILSRLKKELHPNLYYHCLEHTIDVHRAALRLVKTEHPPETSVKIIETAALYHDAGMIMTYRNHEEASCRIAREILPGFGYTPEEIDDIASLIMVTTLPQAAETLPQMILCDADLDALGREDFFLTSFQLHLEWKLFNIRHMSISEWIRFEIGFLENHRYYTGSARKLRDERKSRNIEELRELLDS
jgi:hypothetical protein